jgi:hypothetical protein
MNDERLQRMRDIIQEDLGKRGLASDPARNLLTECHDDFRQACVSIAERDDPALAIVTGFIIPRAEPPCGETDGPLGALFLARALVPIGIRVAFLTDAFGIAALAAGLEECGLDMDVPLIAVDNDATAPLARFKPTHLVALERPGPSHTAATLHAQGITLDEARRELPAEGEDRYHTMGGRDITDMMAPAHRLFEQRPAGVVTIGIGDGGNEIGMGKMPWRIIQRNIPNGGRVACRVATDLLIVAGVSNWGAYGLASGIRLLRGHGPDERLYDVTEEERLLRIMVERGPLVDGVTAKPTATVDGLSFADYAHKLSELRGCC